MKPTESQIQQAFVEYVRVKHPLLSPFLIKITNEGKRSPALGAKMKREGLQKGVPDLFFAKPSYYCAPMYCGMWIEIKAPGKKPTKEQLEYLSRFEKAGYYATWADDLDEIIEYFEKYVLGMTCHDQGRDK